jgi:hypothetical protein
VRLGDLADDRQPEARARPAARRRPAVEAVEDVRTVVRYAQGDREDALRIALAAFLGMCLYGLLFV